MDRLSQIDQWTHPAELYDPLPDGSVRCKACAHRCLVHPGKRGICQIRFNDNGILKAPWGYVAGAAVDPIEKKPFNHFLPGSSALTFGMLGCNFHCDFCQNWVSSQALRDPAARVSLQSLTRVSPEQLVEYADRNGAEVVASSYNEPIITSEWAVDIFKLAKQRGMKTVMISNGYATAEALEYLRPWLDGYKIDLKSMQPAHYREMGGVLDHVLESIKKAKELGFWVEVVTLVIPGFNDSTQELWDTSRFITSVSPDIPWHVTAFHPDYKKDDVPATSSAKLKEAAEIGQEAGLHYVYAGNLPGRVGSLENTYCPKCGYELVGRRGYQITSYHITADGKCSACSQPVAGVWTQHPEKVTLEGWGWPRGIY